MTLKALVGKNRPDITTKVHDRIGNDERICRESHADCEQAAEERLDVTI